MCELIIKFIIKIMNTPIVLLIVKGLFITVITFFIKHEIAKKHSFNVKWADEFFLTNKKFMNGIERYLALLSSLQNMKTPNDQLDTQYQQELNALNVNLPEFQIRLKRLTLLCPKNQKEIINFSEDILSKLSEMVQTQHGNFDTIKNLLIDFNKSVKKGHAEILKIKTNRVRQ